MRFEYATATRIIFGAGRFREAGALAKEFGHRALLVTGRDLRRAEPLNQSLKAEGIAAISFSVFGEPSIETVEKGVALAREQRCEQVISVGGGSAIDAGKAISAMLTNKGELLDYLEVIGRGDSISNPAAPFMAIPTTAGTGSEVTKNAVLASPEHHIKVSLRSTLMTPRLALVDPELTYDLPPALTASTGLDALTQLIEPYVCSRANPMTDALAVEGIPRIARALRTAFLTGNETTAREDMSLASLFGGLALSNAGLGAVHGFAGPIGGMFAAPHGAIFAALLPEVMEMNLKALRERQPANPAIGRYEQVAGFLTGNSSARASDGVDWVRQLIADLQIPRLATHGLKPEHTSELMEKATQASSMKANPIVLTHKELEAVLAGAM